MREKMEKTKLWNKAKTRLFELYGEDPDIRIVNRFLSEQQAFSQFDCITYFDAIARLRGEVGEKGEILIGKSVLGSSFTAYLLGATDVNPLPLHEYCEDCKKAVFLDAYSKKFPFDLEGKECSCGGETYYNGFDIPFETYLPYVKKGVEFNSKNYRELYDEITSHITPSLCILTDRCCELERRTGRPMLTFYLGDKSVLSHFCEGDFIGFSEDEAKLLCEMAKIAKPQTYGDILKLLGLAHGTQSWCHSAGELLLNGDCTLSDIPATRDEVFTDIRDVLRKNGIADTGFAYDVANKARKGYYSEHGMDGYTHKTLRDLGFEDWYIAYLLRVRHLAPKALSVTELTYRIILASYCLAFPEEYREGEKKT